MKSDSKKTENSGSQSKADQEFHETILEAYSLQEKDRKAFQKWAKEANKEGWRRGNDPNFNAYYVASKLPPNLYRRFFSFCEKNNWSKSTAVKFAIHHLLSSKNV